MKEPLRRPKFVSFFSSLLLFAASLLIGLLMAEGVLRLKNADQRNYNIEMWRYARLLKFRSPIEELGHEHLPNRQAKLEGVLIRTNNLGMRGPDVVPSKSNMKRILFLGSSNTLGWGVDEDKTLTGLLAKKLEGRAEVLNGGIGNYNARRYVTLFEKRLRKLKPDVVVVHYFLRDAEPLPPGGGNFLLRHSQLAVTLYHIFNEFSFSSKDPSKFIDHYRRIYAPGSPGLSEMESSLTQLNQMAKEDGFRVVLAMLPDIHAVSPYPFDFIHEHMRNFAGSLGWTFVDFRQTLDTVPQKDLWVIPGDPHINARGHALMADTLLPSLE